MTPHAWDRLIDDVARDMTTADPSSEFRARVMEQVSTTRPARRRAPVAWLAAAAAVTITAVAFSVARPFQSVEPERASASVATPANPIPVTADPAIHAAPVAAVASGRRAPAPQVPAALVEWRERNIPALDSVDALELEPIQPAGLSISQLSVTPLDIAPIVVPAISQVEGGR